MNSKMIVIRKDKENNKEWVYIINDSIYEIERKSDNKYILKKLMELERILKSEQSFSYELKLLDEEEYKILLFNYDINDMKAPSTGSFFSFLVSYSRKLDEYHSKRPSNIYMTNNNYDQLKFWVNQTINKVTIQNETKKK